MHAGQRLQVVAEAEAERVVNAVAGAGQIDADAAALQLDARHLHAVDHAAELVESALAAAAELAIPAANLRSDQLHHRQVMAKATKDNGRFVRSDILKQLAEDGFLRIIDLDLGLAVVLDDIPASHLLQPQQ